MKDKISIITIFSNSELYIFKTIHSVNNQIINDNFNVEYILINNHSKDQSCEIIDTYFNSFKNDKIDVRIIETSEHLSDGRAHQFGIEQSTGNYIMFLNHDNYYINYDILIKTYSLAKKYNADIVEFGFTAFNYLNYSNEDYSIPKPILLDNNKNANMQLLLKDGAISFMIFTKLIKKEIVTSVKFNEAEIFNDIQTTPKWVFNANKILIMNSIEVNFRCANDSIFRQDLNTIHYETVYAISSLFEYFKDSLYILKLLYTRSLSDLKTILELDSTDQYFNKMSALNTKMLSYIYPDNVNTFTYNIE